LSNTYERGIIEVKLILSKAQLIFYTKFGRSILQDLLELWYSILNSSDTICPKSLKNKKRKKEKFLLTE